MPADQAPKLLAVFALCLFLGGAVNNDAIRFDALGPEGFLRGWTARHRAPGLLELRQEDADVSRLTYTVQVLDAERGDFLFADAETGQETAVRLSDQIEGFSPADARALRNGSFALTDGEEIGSRRSGSLTYLKPSDSLRAYVVRR